jgi:hypothetical protein
LAVAETHIDSLWEDQGELKESSLRSFAEINETLDMHDARLAVLETVWKVAGVLFHPVFWRVAGGMFIVAAALSSTPLGKQILAVVPTP